MPEPGTRWSLLVLPLALLAAWQLHQLRGAAEALPAPPLQCRHGHLDITDPARVPALALELRPDAESGWNLHLRTSRFRFAPDKVNQAPVLGEGHAHLYLDGQKLARLYGPWTHLPPLPPGRHRLRVTLNGNDHAELHAQGRPVAAEQFVDG
jgi:hypothetical protein